jgi:hypothetical protein
MDQDEKPRSAVELALERLRKKDTDSGVVGRTITEEQKTAIAEARSLHASKVAELEIMHRSKMTGIFDPSERGRAEDDYRREMQRLNDTLEAKVQKMRATGVD